jgi:transposase
LSHRRLTLLAIQQTMGRGPALSERERDKIEGLGQAGVGIRAISRQVRRSTDAVRRALKGDSSKPRKMMGPTPSLSERDVRRLVRQASTGDNTAPQLRSMLNLTPSVRTIQRVLSNVDWLCYAKLNITLPLSKADKAGRKAWAWKMLMHVEGKAVWEKIIFFRRKKWNLDGPDGFQHYWRDLRRPPRENRRRQAGGGSCMVWAGFSAKGKTKIAFLTGRQNSEDYIYTVSEFVLPFAHLNYGTEFIYQQDGASIHTSKASMAFLEEQGVQVLEWTPQSPDLNPIENMWSIMTRRVYHNGRQFNTVADLRAAIEAAWESIEPKIIRSLIDSMPRRCQEVIEKNGNKTHYKLKLSRTIIPV